MDTVALLKVTLELVNKESSHLENVMARLFVTDQGFNEATLTALLNFPEGIDRLESFGAKFGRLQDTLVDKLFPRYLNALGERLGAAIDNLNRMEALGLIQESDQWLAMRRLRNRLVHEYVDNVAELATALNEARQAGKRLLDTVRKLQDDIGTRWPDRDARQ